MELNIGFDDVMKGSKILVNPGIYLLKNFMEIAEIMY